MPLEFPNQKIRASKASDRARFFIIDSLNAWLIVNLLCVDFKHEAFQGNPIPLGTYIIRESFEKIVLPEIDLVKEEMTFKGVYDQDEIWIDGNMYEIRSENTATESEPKYQWWLE
jgi:hypothetical protein